MSQQRKKLIIAAIVAAAVIAASVAAVFVPAKTELTSLPPEDKEMSAAMDAARSYLVLSPTFSFDGVENSVDIVAPVESYKLADSERFQYNVKIAFDSTHAGYGNRSDQVLAQAVTHHTADISVSDGKVISAIIDNTWDELHQSYIVPLESDSQLGITTDMDQYQSGQTITITITNNGKTRLFPVGWGYSIVGSDGQKYAPNGVLKMMLVALTPGQSIHWTWNQHDENDSQVEAGVYKIVGSYVEEGTEKEVTASKEVKISPSQKFASTDDTSEPFHGMATDYDTLIEAIKSRGVSVEQTDEIAAESSTFSVPTKVISVGGADVQVFEFASESDATSAVLTVSEDGTQIGNSMIRWIDQPHFYANGKLIVLYVGQNPEIINLLESFLGNQFAGM